MKAMASVMALVVIGNAHAKWFGLGEDYPFSNQGPDRSRFIAAATQACLATAKLKEIYRLSSPQTLYMCHCRAEKLADRVTKTENDYADNTGKITDSIRDEVHAIDGECLGEMIGNSTDMENSSGPR